MGQWRLTLRLQQSATRRLRLWVMRGVREARHITRWKILFPWSKLNFHCFQDEEPVEKEDEWGFYPELRHRPSVLSSDSFSQSLNPSSLTDSFIDSPLSPHLSWGCTETLVRQTLPKTWRCGGRIKAKFIGLHYTAQRCPPWDSESGQYGGKH